MDAVVVDAVAVVVGLDYFQHLCLEERRVFCLVRRRKVMDGPSSGQPEGCWISMNVGKSDISKLLIHWWVDNFKK